MFQKYICPLGAKFKTTTYMNKAWVHPCTKFGIDQVKGSKDIEWTTHLARKEWFDLGL